MWLLHWKLFHNRSFKNVSNSSSVVELRWPPLSKLLVYRYACNKIILEIL
jgi:hypothetical protein